jgi:hypothetical protein
VFFQRGPVGGTNQCLGWQNAGCRTPGDPFLPDKFGDRIAIFIGHFSPSVANSPLMAGLFHLRQAQMGPCASILRAASIVKMVNMIP